MFAMLDLETTGSSYNSGIISIGAVVFDPGKVDTVESIPEIRKFSAVVDLNSQHHLDFEISPSTFYWWLQQPQKAREDIIPTSDKPKTSLRRALIEFTSWYNSFKPLTTGIPTFAYGATFDHTIFQHAFNVMKLRNPIHYRDQLCMRTLVNLVKVSCPQIEGLVNHRALDDAIRQTIWLQMILEKLAGGVE